MRRAVLNCLMLASSCALPIPALACVVMYPAQPPLNAVPARTISTIRVLVLSISQERKYQAPIVATVRFLRSYRGRPPTWNVGKVTFNLPPCSSAAVSVHVGADLVIYSPTQPKVWSVGSWVEYRRAQAFDPLVRKGK